MITGPDLMRELSRRADIVVPHFFPKAKKAGKAWKMGDLQGAEGNSAGWFHSAKDGNLLCKDSETDTTKNVLQMIHEVVGGGWKDTFREAKDICQIKEVEPLYQRKVPPTPNVEVGNIRDTDVLKYFNSRGIKESTLVKYGVRSFEKSGKLYWTAPFHDEGGELRMLKFTALDRPNGKKDIFSTDSYPSLFGLAQVDDDSFELTITEGEIDAMSLYQIGCPTPVLSVPTGTGQMDWIDLCWTTLSRMTRINIVMDTDAPGEMAFEKISMRLGRARCYKLQLPDVKDANEWLVKAKPSSEDLHQIIRHADTCVPSGISTASQYTRAVAQRISEMETEEQNNKFMWPELKFAIRPAELTLVTGYPSHGKSEWSYACALHECMENNRRAVFCSFEIPIQDQIHCMSWIHKKEKPTLHNHSEIIENINDNIYFINTDTLSGDNPWEEMAENFEYAIRRWNCDLFVIDSLQYLSAKTDWSQQDKVIKAMSKWCISTSTSVMLICHADAKKDIAGNERVPRGVEDILGSQSIGACANNCIAIWRNLKKEREVSEGNWERVQGQPDGKFVISKQRTNGKSYFENLTYNTSTRSFHLELPNHLDQNKYNLIVDEF